MVPISFLYSESVIHICMIFLFGGMLVGFVAAFLVFSPIFSPYYYPRALGFLRLKCSRYFELSDDEVENFRRSNLARKIRQARKNA